MNEIESEKDRLLAQHAEKDRGMFPASSMPDRDWWAALWSDPSAMLHTLGIRPGMTALDLCCGDGYFTASLAKLVAGRVYALDLDPLLLDVAKAEVARQGASVKEWICADARHVGRYVAEPLDYVLLANTIHGVPDQRGLVRAVRSVLKPDGFFGVVNWHPTPRNQTMVSGKPRGPRTDLRMSPDAVKEVVEREGFRLAKQVDLPPYHYGAVFARQELR
ncbi:MAG: class I SAM-dependent methyltransferase [bacterium]|nr:class I SAM-dependent methyltransferase [bacterium]